MADQRSTPQEQEISLAKALFTQSDWSGPVSIGSWFGRHSPWRRIFFFLILSSWSWTLTTLYQLYIFQSNEELGQIPIIQARTREEIDTIKASHEKCFVSLCDEIGSATQIDCIVNDDGVTSRVEYGDDVSNPIYFPEACHEAVEATFGDRYLDGFPDQDVPPIAFITLQEGGKFNNETNQKSHSSLLTLLPDCSVMISDPEMSPAEFKALKEKLGVHAAGEWNDLYQEFQQQQNPKAADITLSFDLLNLANNQKQQPLPPGHRESHILKNVFCVDEMPLEIQQQVLPQLATLYNFLMVYRLEILTVALYASNLCFSTMAIGWLMVRLILPAWVLKRVFKWPSSIHTYQIWRTLLLLTVTTSFRLTSPFLTGILALGALWFGNGTAAMEWSFLGMTAWAATDTIYPFLDEVVGKQLARADGLNVLYWTTHMFVIGEGWWKLVTVYVVYRAYQSLQESLRPPPLEQTQLQGQFINGQQQQQHEQHEHAKVE